ncbi:MAG TPA: hypothetical protein VF702_07985 [Allosphingosinicella sp.]
MAPLLAASLAVAQAASPAPPSANPQPSIPLGTVEGWGLYDNIGDCSILTEYESGAYLRVAYEYGENRAWFSIDNPAWRSIEQGRQYQIGVFFSNGAQYGPVGAFGMNSVYEGARMTGLLAIFHAEDFLRDFAESASIVVTMDEARLGAVALEGTRAAVARLRTCALDTHRRNPPDPAANLPPPRK